MPETQKFCPKCGAANKGDVKFCQACGEHFASAGLSGAETIRKASDVVNTVTSTVSKVESTLSTAGKITQTAGELSQVVIRPPAKWEVVVGEVLPAAGQKIVDTAISTAQKQVEKKVKEEVSKQITEKFGTSTQPGAGSMNDSQESFVQKKSDVTAIPGVACPNCGNPLKPGAKFCGACGASSVSAAPSPAVPVCLSCGKPLVPGKKFCGSCGHKIS